MTGVGWSALFDGSLIFFSPNHLWWKEPVSRFHSRKKLLEVEGLGRVILGRFKLARQELIKY